MVSTINELQLKPDIQGRRVASSLSPKQIGQVSNSYILSLQSTWPHSLTLSQDSQLQQYLCHQHLAASEPLSPLL